jgi:steroid delta-isomerase-like uncharacterized protein
MEDNKQIVRSFFEVVWNKRKLELADSIFDSKCYTHQLLSGELVNQVLRGPEEIKAHISEWLLGFPDLLFTVEQILAEGDRVCTQLFLDGTHTGEWNGIPPTGKHLNIRMMTIHLIQDGRIIEDWVIVESLGVFQQLGMLPPTVEFMAQFAQRKGSTEIES